jgi:hypothetical protein
MAEPRFIEKAYDEMGRDKKQFITLHNITAKELKIFLGGTTAGKDYRDELIPKLTRPFFNPVVEKWDEEAQKNERYEKSICGVHLYVITPDMQGFFSIAEILDSCYTKGVLTILSIEESLRWKNWNGNDVTTSLEAVRMLAMQSGAISVNKESLASFLNDSLLGSELKNRTVPSVEFQIQSDPVSEVGVNGVQAQDLLQYAKHLLRKLNDKFPCEENRQSILKVMEALHWQDARTKDRLKRGVEGTNKE